MKMDIAHLLFIILTFDSSVLASFNTALHKPAFQSSAWSRSFSTDSGNVVDGNLDRNMNNGHCTATRDDDLNPWWAVDLGKPFKIHNITVVNRGDWKKEYLHDFYIEMFGVHPVTWNSTRVQHCLFYDGILYDVETLTCDVPVTGRYVRIRKIPRPGKVNLFLCEVEIAGLEAQKQDCGFNDLPVYGGKMLQTSSKEVVTSESLPDCLCRCKYDMYCYDINYNSLTQSCEKILARSDADVLLDDQEWTFLSLP